MEKIKRYIDRRRVRVAGWLMGSKRCSVIGDMERLVRQLSTIEEDFIEPDVLFTERQFKIARRTLFLSRKAKDIVGEMGNGSL